MTEKQKMTDPSTLRQLAVDVAKAHTRPHQADNGDSHQQKASTPHIAPINFSMKPKELINYLSERVVKQTHAIRTLATTVCTHYNAIRYMQEQDIDPMTHFDTIKPNIMLIGPTGVGKTYIVKHIANKLNVPFIKADATKFSETGYVGGDVEDLIRDLVKEAKGDIEAAQYGIVYLDEIDKIASDARMMGRDVSGSGVQRGLLKIIEDTEVDLMTKNDLFEQINVVKEYQQTGKVTPKKMSTRNILFIFSGSFDGIYDIIQKRLNKTSIGFEADVESTTDKIHYLNDISALDLIEFGFESEFIGRIPIIVTLEMLAEEDLVMILNNPHNAIINKKKIDFAAYGIDLRFSDDAFILYAKQAYLQRTGARALASVVNQTLLNYETEFPDTDVSEFVMNAAMIQLAEDEDNQQRFIEHVREESSLNRYQVGVHYHFGLKFQFTDNARLAIFKLSKQLEQSPFDYCYHAFKPLEQAFLLLSQQHTDRQICINEDALKDPARFINDMIKQDHHNDGI